MSKNKKYKIRSGGQLWECISKITISDGSNVECVKAIIQNTKSNSNITFLQKSQALKGRVKND